MKSIRRSLKYSVAIIVSVSFLLMTCKKKEFKPVIYVSTGMVSNISFTTCTVFGTISSLGNGITQHGFCWSESSNPSINDSKIDLGIKSTTGSFTGDLTNLTQNTNYHVRAYAISNDEPVYGESISFTTLAYTPGIISTSAVDNITENSARCGGSITDDGGSPITARGVCWNTSPNPTIANTHTTDGSGEGSYTSSLTNLSPSTTYYVRAYATNSVGTAYGPQIEFNTLSDPSALIAIIYKDDATDANSFKTLLLEYGADVSLIEIDNVASTDFSNYNLILIASNTSFSNEWGTTQAVNNIINSGKLILGLGAGGAGFFEEYGLSINWGHSWYGTSSTSPGNTSIFCVIKTHHVFTSPTMITIPGNNIIQLYSESGHVGEYAPSLNQGVLLIGREPTDANHYSIVSENSHWLWGFTNSPTYMTQTGKYLFLNIVDYMLD